MNQDQKHFAITAQSWVREDGIVKVPHPVSYRLIYLSGARADVFELLDAGLDIEEILAKLGPKYGEFSRDRIEDIVRLLCELRVVQPTDQFD